MADYCLLIQGSDGDLLEDGDDLLLGVGLDVPVQCHGMVSLLPHHFTMALAKGILKLVVEQVWSNCLVVLASIWRVFWSSLGHEVSENSWLAELKRVSSLLSKLS